MTELHNNETQNSSYNTYSSSYSAGSNTGTPSSGTGYTGQNAGYTGQGTGYTGYGYPQSGTGYQPNFTLPQSGYPDPRTPKKPKTPRQKQKNGHGGLKALGVAAAFLVFMGGSFGFGYLGSQTALRTAGTDTVSQSSGAGSSAAEDSSSVSQVLSGGSDSTIEPYTTVQDVAAAVANTVVEITTESVQTDNYFRQHITSGAGSGVIISEDGYIVTNNHVVEGANKITVTMRDGTQYEGTLVGTDSRTDIAVVKVEGSGFQAAKLGDSSTLQVGELAVVIGNPLGQLGGTVTNGIISALDREITIDGETMTLLQTNAAINPGNSGGGLFNASGELVGIVNAKSGGTTSSGTTIEGLGFAIPIDTAKPVIEDLISYGYVQGRIDIGMTFLDISDPISVMLYGVSDVGVYVTDVVEGSNADETGIRIGDRIVALDGQNISSTDDITNILNQHSVGDEISVVVSRNGRQGSGTIILEEYKGEDSSATTIGQLRG